MTIFVIGGAGFIGRRVVRALAETGLDVVSLDVNTAVQPGPSEVKYRTLRVDLSTFEDVLSAVSIHKPEVVINLSYLRETTPWTALRVNVVGMDNCFEAARRCGVRHVIYASSIAVNGRQMQYGNRAIAETDPTFPTYQYAVHKVFNEWQAKEYREKHGMRITGLRVAHAAAPDKLVGAVDHVQCVVGPALGEEVRLKYRDMKRCVIHVDDVAHVFRAIALKETPDHNLYNTGGQTLSLGEIADMVRAIVPAAAITFAHDIGGDEASVAYRFDNSRLASEFGIAFPPYEQRVAEMIAFVRKSRGI